VSGPCGGSRKAGRKFLAILPGEGSKHPSMDLDQASITSQGRDWPASQTDATRSRGICAGADRADRGGGGDADGMPDPPSIGLDDRVRQLAGYAVAVGAGVGRVGMMRPSADVQVYLHREPIDMRRGRNGLAALVREGMRQDPFATQALYVFIGRRGDRVS